jgi:hypothetical protein
MRPLKYNLANPKAAGDWRLIYFLTGLTLIATLLSLSASQVQGVYFYWILLGLMLTFNLLRGKDWRTFLILITALATLSVFQAGIIIGYRSWYYITIVTAIFLTFRRNAKYFSMPGFRWWFLLVMLGAARLFFIESEAAFGYSRGAVLQIAAGLSAFAIGYQCLTQREYGEAISQLSFLIMAVCTISLLIPLYLTEGESMRLGEGIGMDANGLGITATYAFFAMLLYSLTEKKKRIFIIIGIVTLFLVVVLIRTGSRQSISTNLLMFGIFFIFSFRGKIKLRSLVIIAGIFISLSVFVSVGQLSYLEARYNKAFGAEGKIDRLDYLKASIYMAADHPMGMGGGGFKENFNEYKYKAGIESVYTNVSPHSLFGMVLADWGVPGIFLLLAGFYSLSRHIMRLKGLAFTVKILSLIIYFFLANSGMSFPPIFMSFLGQKDPVEMGGTRRRRIRW